MIAIQTQAQITKFLLEVVSVFEDTVDRNGYNDFGIYACSRLDEFGVKCNVINIEAKSEWGIWGNGT